MWRCCTFLTWFMLLGSVSSRWCKKKKYLTVWRDTCVVCKGKWATRDITEGWLPQLCIPCRSLYEKKTKGESNKGWTFLISLHLADVQRYGSSELKSESQCRPLPYNSSSITGMWCNDKKANHDFHFYGNLSPFH